ncbi:helix-turn-helix XRE-family transcriptional regulators [Candidatus Termititenax persephonae]|uniref:Helix-turn-helix XRE-family transcriptional regulators n=1 Tax=Candidatus Termititenax persephonae TaxID=2218525 RepID=A0A388TH71_9BACT|nr:helix-turn-helix XRE-family transcriptional regulators [Candidatus Termititenax persephonae]
MVKFSKYDFADYLKNEEDVRVYLETAFESGDTGFIAYALGNVAKAHGMGRIAKKAGVNRESLYRSLSRRKNPYFSTISKVMNSLGYSLTFTAAQKKHSKGLKRGLHPIY